MNAEINMPHIYLQYNFQAYIQIESALLGRVLIVKDWFLSSEHCHLWCLLWVWL